MPLRAFATVRPSARTCTVPGRFRMVSPPSLLSCVLLAAAAIPAAAQTQWGPTTGDQSSSVATPASDASRDIIVSHGLSTFGDLKYPAEFTHFDHANPDAPRGGTLSFRGTGASSTFDSLNPFIVKGEAAQGMERIYDTLMARAEDEPDAVYGLIASRVEYPADLSGITFELRPEATFSDGTPLTAEDVAFTFRTLAEDGLPYYRVAFAAIADIAAEGPHRIRFDFAEGQGGPGIALEIAETEILPRHAYGEGDFARASLDVPIGSGPYIVSDVDVGRSITYCRNPDYWGRDLPVNRGRDNFDCVRYEYFLDGTAAFEALKAGEYLFHEEFSSALWATNYDFPALDKGWIRREAIPDERPSGAQGFWINLRRPHLQDIRVREAIGMMFNFRWSNETLFYGLYARTDSFWENSDLEAAGPPSEAERAILIEAGESGDILTADAFLPPEGSARQLDRTAIAQAGALLDAAGWTVGDDGRRRDASGQGLSLAIVYDNPAFERIVLPFIENLSRLGIDARNDLIPPGDMTRRRDAFDYDLTVARYVMPQTPAAELRSLFGSAAADQEGSLNLSGIDDPVVDALIDRVLSVKTKADLVTAVNALDRVLRARQIWVPNWSKAEHWLAYWDVFDRPDVKPRYGRGLDWWWYDASRADALRDQGALP